MPANHLATNNGLPKARGEDQQRAAPLRTVALERFDGPMLVRPQVQLAGNALRNCLGKPPQVKPGPELNL